MIKILIFCFAFLLATFAFTGSIAAQQTTRQYIVRPYLVIPSDWNTPETLEQIPTFKQDILQALEEVQTWYAENANGKTFNLDEEVRVVFPQTAVVERRLGNSNIEDLVPNEENGVVNTNWIVGLWSGSALGTGAGNQLSSIGNARLSFDQLLDLHNVEIKEGISYRENAIKILTHELGHAFGLVNAGYALSHPCTQISKNECRDGAPQPLPQPEEWNGSVMGQAFTSFSRVKFNNSIHNPELWKLYGSAFVNPQREPAPSPFGAAKPPFRPTIFYVNPQPVEVGSVLEIHGNSFGENKGEVNLFQRFYSTRENKVEQIVEWSDQLIKFVVEKPADMICIIVPSPTEPNTTIGECANIKIEGVPLPPILTINLSTTCGEPKRPLPIFSDYKKLLGVELNKLEDNGQETQKMNWSINATAKLQALFLIGSESPVALTEGNHVLRAPVLEDVSPTPEIVPIEITDITKSQELTANFHYPECPVQPSPTPTPTSTATPSATPIGTFVTGSASCTKPHNHLTKDHFDVSIDMNIPPQKSDLSVWTTITDDRSGSTGLLSSGGAGKSHTELHDSFSSIRGPGTTMSFTPNTKYTVKVWAAPYTTENPKFDNLITQTTFITGECGELEQVIISNYPDFRENNTPIDEGSETKVIENPSENQEIKWQDSTLSEDQPVYVREVYEDETVKDYQADLDNGEKTLVGNVQIEEVEQPVQEKRVTKISIEDSVIWSKEEGSFPVNLNLNDQQVYTIWVYYSDDTSKPFSLTFQKSVQEEPSTQEPESTDCLTSCGIENGLNCTDQEKADKECADSWEDDSTCSFTDYGPPERGDGCIP
ncbi:MAG: hypothetical protein AAB414_00365 [Patescibacteria group bacterium]